MNLDEVIEILLVRPKVFIRIILKFYNFKNRELLIKYKDIFDSKSKRALGYYNTRQYFDYKSKKEFGYDPKQYLRHNINIVFRENDLCDLDSPLKDCVDTSFLGYGYRNVQWSLSFLEKLLLEEYKDSSTKNSNFDIEFMNKESDFYKRVISDIYFSISGKRKKSQWWTPNEENMYSSSYLGKHESPYPNGFLRKYGFATNFYNTSDFREIEVSFDFIDLVIETNKKTGFGLYLKGLEFKLLKLNWTVDKILFYDDFESIFGCYDFLSYIIKDSKMFDELSKYDSEKLKVFESINKHSVFPITKNIIEKYKENLNFNELLENNTSLVYTEEILEQNKDKIDINKLLNRKRVIFDENILDKYINTWNWDLLSEILDLSFFHELLDKYRDKWNWNILSSNKNIIFTKELLDMFLDKWNWYNLSSNYNIIFTEELLDKYIDKWNWSKICYQYSNLDFTEELIQKYENKWNWGNLSYYLVFFNFSFTEELIQKYEDKWDWFCLSNSRNIHFTEELLEKYIDKWDWDNLNSNFIVDCLSKEFINKHNKWTDKLKEKYMGRTLFFERNKPMKTINGILPNITFHIGFNEFDLINIELSKELVIKYNDEIYEENDCTGMGDDHGINIKEGNYSFIFDNFDKCIWEYYLKEDLTDEIIDKIFEKIL